ncbi:MULTISPECIES: sigma-54 dependent transcriptional regulator [unclassified Sphingomonas]|uniref:sigma-54-dependent transcriptional regulator n=1 Tax=unclassified Sphingomonas TaxID=196159 RepID=UPI00226A52E0|nr:MULTISPECIES: sigma-54 dependent transcriptional regulator [unclassified Sphingomonas]
MTKAAPMPASPPFARCLVVDDDEDILLSARLLLAPMFAEVTTTMSPAEAVAMMTRTPVDLVLLDANFARGATDGAEGFAWLARMIAADPAAAIVMITAHSSVGVAVAAMKHGATDFVSKPWNNDRLLATVRNAASLGRSRRGNGTEAPTATAASPLLGGSPAMARVQSLIEKAAPTDANVLILGENGTGKELVARELHRLSRRAAREMVTVDLGAVAETLFDSELFGHAKGAFTDARADRVGRLQAADGSTLFLDEIGNLPLHLQPKLLTALEQRRVTPVGSNKSIPIDVRVISATNAAVDDERSFRQDLLFRLNTVEIELPGLRERREDIPLLLATFLAEARARYDKPDRRLPAELRAALVAHDWPGNVRALRHAAERAVILAEGPSYTADDFPLGRTATPPVAPASPTPASPASDDLNLDRVERQAIEQALKKHAFNISTAASELGLSRGTLYRRMEKHGL